ncbi:PAS domain S-box-containing protein [Gracilimonas mengyeensis]|uniref:Oxygen sensor histidine kinase NreB n=2 Tax=Gracilimonas mengyeensis TaxID=1302730 RepID=A0A521CFY3_9BACT|nr:PAS domain S-box-containing protein [Gracilimonas mengyeensis]
MRRILKIFELNAFSITFAYLVFALLWILVSDKVLIWLTQDPQLISKLQTYKGIFYVLGTSVFLYVLMRINNERLASEKELFEGIFEHIPILISVFDPEINKIKVNKAFEKQLGWSNKDVQEVDLMEKCYPDSNMRRKAAQVMLEADGEWYEFEVQHRSGEVRSQRWCNIRLSDNTLVGIGLDVTDQKRLEEKLERERLELKKIYDNIPVFINLHDNKGKVYRVNRYFEEKTGYENRSLQSFNLIEEMFPDKDRREKAEEHMAVANGEWKDFKMHTKDGKEIESTWTNIQVTEDLTIGIGLDTTNLKEKERALQELTQRYRDAEKLTNIGHWKRNLKTNESTVSDGFYEVTELDNEEGISFEKLKEIIHEKDWPYFAEEVEKAQQTGRLEIDYRIKKAKSGEIAYIRELGTVDFGEGGEPQVIRGTIQDVTDTVQQQKKLEQVTQRYQKAEEIAGLGHWYRDLKLDEAIWSDGFYNLVDIKKGTADTSFEGMMAMIHPDDKTEYERVFKDGLENGTMNVRYRLIKPGTGDIVHLQELGKTIYDTEGTPVAMSGTIQDITEREEFQRRLKERNEFIETTLQNLPIGVAVNMMDTGASTLANDKYSDIYGWPQKVLNDEESFYKSIFPEPEYRRKMYDMIEADINSSNPERMHWERLEIQTQSGEERIVNAKVIPVEKQNLMISTVVDVTRQVKAERRLAESEHNYRLLFLKSPLPMWIYDPKTLRFVEVNNAAISHYGYSRKEFYEMTLRDIRPKEDLELFNKEISGHLEKFAPPEEWRHVTKSGEIIYVKITGSAINYFGQNYRLILVNDITEQKKAEEMVLASLVEGENKERARIARELHDGLGQYLAAARMNFEAVETATDQLTERKKEQFKKGLNLLKNAVNETSEISRNLLPRVVDDYGLVMAIESLLDNYRGSTGAKISFYNNVDELELKREVEFNLYRITQEALSNVMKYAEADKINIQLVKDDLDLMLTIDDNGKGFDIESSGFEPGLGLQTIKTRAGALGGEIQIESRPGEGTFISVTIPEQNAIKSE